MDTRESLRRMRNFKKGVIENFDKPIKEEKKNLTVRDTLNVIRKFKAINEADVEQIDLNNDGEKESKLIDTSIDSRKTALDQEAEEEKFRNAIKEFNVDVQFLPIEILDNSIVWNGTIDNQLQWSFLVTPDDTVNNVMFNYSKNFDDTKPENTELVDRIKNYYNDFYKFWRDNELEK
jgi:hypothetical protein